MFEKLFGLDYQRKRLLKKAPTGPIQDYLQQPFPEKKRDWRDVEYLAMDLETTGLDPRKDHILSFGMVVVRGHLIDLSTAQHILLQTKREITEESAVIHQITHDRMAEGARIEQILPRVLAELSGRVLIAHHAKVEIGFVSKACEGVYGIRPPLPAVDTQAVALRLFQRRNITVAPAEMRLGALRERYKLPRYPAHNALSDALAAAELFLAQAAHRDQGKGMSLGEFLLN